MAAHNVVIHGKDATTGLPTDIDVINNAASVVAQYPANMYIWADFINSAGTTNNSCQLANPAGSGVNVIIQTAKLFLSGAGSIRLYVDSTQLSAEITDDRSSLDTTGTAPSAKIYAQVDVTIDGTRIGDIYFGSSQDKEMIGMAGFKIEPGHNLTFHCPTDLVICPVITWSEEAI